MLDARYIRKVALSVTACIVGVAFVATVTVHRRVRRLTDQADLTRRDLDALLALARDRTRWERPGG